MDVVCVGVANRVGKLRPPAEQGDIILEGALSPFRASENLRAIIWMMQNNANNALFLLFPSRRGRFWHRIVLVATISEEACVGRNYEGRKQSNMQLK